MRRRVRPEGTLGSRCPLVLTVGRVSIRTNSFRLHVLGDAGQDRILVEDPLDRTGKSSKGKDMGIPGMPSPWCQAELVPVIAVSWRYGDGPAKAKIDRSRCAHCWISRWRAFRPICSPSPSSHRLNRPKPSIWFPMSSISAEQSPFLGQVHRRLVGPSRC